MLSVHLPTNKKCYQSAYLPFKIIVCVSLKCYPSRLPTNKKKMLGYISKNVSVPTYQQKMLSVHLPTNKKCYPSKNVGLHFKIIVCVSKNVIRPAYLNVIRPPTYQQKCYPSTYLPTKNVIRWAAFQNNCLCFFKKIFV